MINKPRGLFCPGAAGKAFLAGICLALGVLGPVQEAEAGDSPLDTLLHTKIWADVPEAKDFVRDSRPPPESLSYQPLTGADPVRPQLRTKAELDTLENELERAAAHNYRRAGKRWPIKKPAAAKTAAGE